MKTELVKAIEEAMGFNGFDTDMVENIESNAGSVWFDHDGKRYFVMIDECEE